MRRTNITFSVFFISIATLFTLTVANAKWRVIREDDVIRNDGIQGMLNDIHFMDKQHGLIVGENGLVLETADGGKTWTATKTGGSGTLKGVHATDKDHCWTVDDWGVIAAYKPE